MTERSPRERSRDWPDPDGPRYGHRVSTGRTRRVGRLPAEWTSFVGRRRELADIKRLLTEHRLVTLTGVAGVGKSRLARRAADQLERATPGGVWWVDLDRVTDPDEVPRAVLGAIVRSPDPVGGPQAALAAFLGEQPTVLVLDNCEHLVASCAELAGALLREAAPLRVLATSREVLRAPGEHVLTVEPLRVPVASPRTGTALTAYPAVALFCQRAAAALPGFALTPANEATIAGICRRLDGLPLAIELAAVRLRALSAEQILHRLDDRLDLLVTGPRTASTRQRTVRGALDWSYDLCTDAERASWARLSVFSGGFDVAAAEFVCDTAPEVLDGLVGKSVLSRTHDDARPRFRLLGTIARYGREKLDHAGTEATLRGRHADWFARLARAAGEAWFGPEELGWVSWLRTEHANVGTALDFLLSRADRGQNALQMVSDLWFYWANAAPATEAQRWLDRALAADPRPTPARAKALWVAAYVATIRFDVDTAQRRLAEAETVATEVGDLSALAWTASRAAAFAMMCQDWAAAAVLAVEALARFAAAGESGGAVVFARLVLAASRLASEDLDDAWRISEDVRVACAGRGELTLHGTALLFLARIHWLRGEPGPATRYLETALRLRPTVPTPTTLTLALDMLGWIGAGAGEFERVAVLYGALAQTRRALGTTLVAHATVRGRPHDDAIAKARLALGTHRYAEAYERGAAMATGQIVAYALGERRRPDADSSPPTLTTREREVAGLVARGLSNRQIANKLVISQRTAETHIEHVLRKLNFSSRAQIAAWAVRLPEVGSDPAPPARHTF
jgi:predicted ATPase/DNA-binding CsgD family transcriptional regulator